MPLPKFRQTVRIVPHKHEDKDVFVVVDQQEALFEHQVILPAFVFVVATFLDGRRDAEGVRKAIAEKLQGAQVGVEEIERVVQELDRHYLVETDRVKARRREVAEEYGKLETRPYRFVKGAKEKIVSELDGYYTAEAGAGRPEKSSPNGLAAVVSPHIDFVRGGNCYSFAFREVAERSDADLYVILGVAHLSPPNPYIVSSKSYDTPLGKAEIDREALDALVSRVGKGCFENEETHRSEHSIEFQATFLKHARPDTKYTVLPILCSGFEPFCGDVSPSTVPRIEEFVGALGEAIKGRKVCILAGVDLSHVGPMFGDPVKVDGDLVNWMVKGDERSLKVATEGNAEAFWNDIMSDGNSRHVCGLSAIYTTLRLLGTSEGKVLKYGFAPDPAGGVVSFASMSFRHKSAD